MRILRTRHVLAVNDLAKSADHYLHALGFTRDFAVDGWEFLSLGDFRVMLGECPDEVPAEETNNHSYFAHVVVDDVDALHADMRARGANIHHALADKPWGLREFGVKTPDGHRMMFAQELE